MDKAALIFGAMCAVIALLIINAIRLETKLDLIISQLQNVNDALAALPERGKEGK